MKLATSVNETQMASMLGANLLFSQIGFNEDELFFSHISTGRLLKFPSGAILYVTAENLPCSGPGDEIHSHYPQVEANRFPKAAMGLRGIVAMVFRPGGANVGDIVEVGQIRGS